MLTVTEINNARRTGRRLSALSFAELKQAVATGARSMLAVSGLSLADGLEDNAQSIAEMIAKQVRYRYAYLTDTEISLALEAGASGEWSRDRRPTGANALSWLRAYASCESRKAAIDAETYARRSTPVSALLPRRDLDRLNEDAGRSSALNEWAAFRREGHLDCLLDGYAAMIYDYLQGRRILNPSEEAVAEAYSRSRIRAMRNRKITDLAALYSDIGHHTGDRRLDFECKRELLEMFYTDLHAKGGELRL